MVGREIPGAVTFNSRNASTRDRLIPAYRFDLPSAPYRSCSLLSRSLIARFPRYSGLNSFVISKQPSTLPVGSGIRNDKASMDPRYRGLGTALKGQPCADLGLRIGRIC